VLKFEYVERRRLECECILQLKFTEMNCTSLSCVLTCPHLCSLLTSGHLPLMKTCAEAVLVILPAKANLATQSNKSDSLYIFLKDQTWSNNRTCFLHLSAIACSGHLAAALYKYSVNQGARRIARERLYSSTKLRNLFWHFELKRLRQRNVVVF